MKDFLKSKTLTLETFSKKSDLNKADSIWKNETFELKITKKEISDGLLFEPEISNPQKEAINIESIEIINVELPEKELRFLRFGLNMPGDPVRFGMLNRNGISPKALSPDSRGCAENEQSYIIDSNSLFVFATPDRKEMTLIGNATFKTSEGTILLECSKNDGSMRLVYKAILDGLELPPETSKKLDGILIIQGSDLNRLLEQWADYTASQKQALIPEKIPTGWNDWQYYRNEKTQEDVLKSSEVIAELKKEGYPLEYSQVDGGFCMHLSEWSKPRPSFSDGIKSLSEKIETMGLKFGLWLAPYIQNRETNVVKEHPEWLLLDKDGKPLELSKSNVGASNLIDYSLDEPLEWLRKLVRMFVDEWNVKWIKLDGPNYALYRPGRLRNRSMTITEMLVRTFEIIREEAGPNVLVEGEGMMGLAMGYVDMHRVQTDNHAKWFTNNIPDEIYAPQVYGKELIMSFLHNRWWCNHRENVILRDHPSHLRISGKENVGKVEQMFNEAEFRTQLTSAVMGSGGLLLTDPMKDLQRTSHRMKWASKLLPVFPKAAKIVDEFPDARYPAAYITEVKANDETFFILGVINWRDEVCDFEFDLERFIGKSEYLGFSFFDKKAIGAISQNFLIKGVTAHGCKLIALRKKQNNPQLLSTSMHLTQGAVDIESAKWNAENKTLKICVKHFEQSDEKIYLAAPENWAIDKIETNAKRFSLDCFDKRYPSIRFEGSDSKRTEFIIHGKNHAEN